MQVSSMTGHAGVLEPTCKHCFHRLESASGAAHQRGVVFRLTFPETVACTLQSGISVFYSASDI